MNLKECRDAYYSFSASASSVTRQAAFAGIAFVWVFSSKEESAISLPAGLLWPAMFFILCLAADLLQYVVSTIIWGLFHRVNERRGKACEDDVKASPYLNWPGLGFFWLKHASVLAAYYTLFSYVLAEIRFS